MGARQPGALTAADGAYTLTLKSSSSGVTDLAGNDLTGTATVTWTMDGTAPTVAVVPVAPSPRRTAVTSVTIEFSEKVVDFTLASLRLTRGGAAVGLTGVKLSTSDGVTWKLTLDGATTTPDGAYELAVLPGVRDAAGNALRAGASVKWVTDRTPPTVALAPVPPGAPGGAVDAVTITFSEKVTGFSLSNLRLKRGSSTLSLSGATLSTVDGVTWVLTGLSGLTAAAGAYTLTLNDTGIDDLAGNGLPADASVGWVKP